MKNGNGFADSQVSWDEFRVDFKANGQTPSQKADDFALLRAAQVTLQHGFSCFAVLNVTNTSSARQYVAHQEFHADYPPAMGLPPPSLSSFEPFRGGYIIQSEEPRIYLRPGTSLLIKCFPSKPAKPFTYDAARLEQELKFKYRLG